MRFTVTKLLTDLILSTNSLQRYPFHYIIFINIINDYN